MKLRRRLAVASLGAIVLGLVPVSPAQAAQAAVRVVDFTFDPDPVQVQPGDTVVWTNEDPGPHTVTADDNSFSYVLNAGESTPPVKFDDEGFVGYFCKFHGAPGEGMHGTVQVGDAPPPQRLKIEAPDNVATAIEWSRATYSDDSSDFAILGRANLFADSLASGALQGKLGAPLLLTSTSALDERVTAELERLAVETVYLLGGTSALSEGVAQALAAKGYAVRRLAGDTRITTATAVANALFDDARKALLVRAAGLDATQGFVDALGAGAVAANELIPTLFTDGGALSGATKAYLQSHPEIDALTIVGGTAAISEGVENEVKALGIEVDRIAGSDRFETAARLAQRVGGEEAEGVVAVDGTNPAGWVDGFAAAGRRDAVVLTAGDAIPGPTLAQLLNAGGSGKALVCGDSVTAKACARLEAVMSTDFELPPLGAFLSGGEEVPPSGSPAEGFAGVYPTSDPGALCYDFFGTPVEGRTAAHIHEAPKGQSGGPVITLNFAPSEDELIGCSFDLDPSLVADIVANPGDYYINFHSTEFPAGAIRGQLFEPGLLGFADLAPESEVPAGSGDPQASGFGQFILADDPNEVCYALGAFGLSSPATAAHIHRGAAGVNGPVVATLEAPGSQFPFSFGCVTLDAALLQEMQANEEAFYVNVHSQAHPGGAIRGQLFNPMDGS